jgi:hypothetical protein
MTFRTSEMTQVFLIAVACSGAGNGQSAFAAFGENFYKLPFRSRPHFCHHPKTNTGITAAAAFVGP